MTADERFVEVAVNSGQPLRQAFTYRVPEGTNVAPGQAVFVPYGTRVLHGIVLDEAEPPSGFEARDIDAAADPQVLLDGVHRTLARWLSRTYIAPLWECVAVSLPSGYGQKHVTMISAVAVPPLLPVDPRDQMVLRLIAERGRATYEQLEEAAGGISMNRLHRLQRAGFLTVAQGLAPPPGHHRVQRVVALAVPPADASNRADELQAMRANSVEARALRHLASHGPTDTGSLGELGVTSRHVQHLVAGGIVTVAERIVERDPMAGHDYPIRDLPRLTPAQQEAADRIASAPGEYLIHGVTGSGKTEVYLDLVGRALRAGKGAIILVPEISLTPQAVRRYGERFGRRLAVIHSKLGTGELYDQWFRIQRGDARVVVGSRSAIFAPVQDLGIVIIDEEHEWTYKQEGIAPRYHARDVARELCRLQAATLVLGSATPDVVTYHRSETGQTTRVELNERVDPGDGGELAGGLLPAISIVDMREELRSGNRGMFSYALLRAVASARRSGEQSLLFVNRRGAARFLLCRDCGYTAQCPACQLAMSLDTSNQLDPRVRCHHCGRGKPLEEYCPACNSRRYRPFGVGTQRVEQEARLMFPGARVLRWDSDTASTKGAHERIVAALENGEVDILVGTQVLAKGLDLPVLTVVGVVDADVGINFPDYTAHERAFQLLSQVAGRAGRRGRRGDVFIQTYEPGNVAIQCAAAHDYRSFFEHEIGHRRRAGYPPFSRIVRLVLRHRNQATGLEEASRVATDLRLRRDVAGRADPDILGPAPAFIPRVGGFHRWQILLRGHAPTTLITNVRLGPGWSVDVDATGLLG